jgi:hypothetical protein
MQKLRSVYGLKFQLDQQTKLQLVKTIIYPHFDYCSLVYYYFLTNKTALSCKKYRMLAYGLCAVYRVDIISGARIPRYYAIDNS